MTVNNNIFLNYITIKLDKNVNNPNCRAISVTVFRIQRDATTATVLPYLATKSSY